MKAEFTECTFANIRQRAVLHLSVLSRGMTLTRHHHRTLTL